MSDLIMDLSGYIYCIVEVKIALQIAVGVATHYGLDDSGIEFRCGRDLPCPSRPALRLTKPTL